MLLYMGRRHKVEGLVLDLTRIVDGEDVCFEDLIVTGPVKHEKKVIIGRKCEICEKKWKCYRRVDDKVACYMCYVLSTAAADVAQFIRNAYSGPCEFCGANDIVKHFDHVNIFRKEYAILSMVDMSIEEIQSEIAKCQLLCIPCHKKVTVAEWRLGLIQKKISVTRMRQKGKVVTDIVAKYADEYDIAMAGIYSDLRGIIRRQFRVIRREHCMNNAKIPKCFPT